ncbi:unnamed protein product, partial [Choristocarpus tenellus]
AAPEIQAIAVLHPRRLGVYTVEAKGGLGVKASYFNLVKAYEHLLGVDGGHFTAYNMVHGDFGGVGRDLLCVQSMDGRLQVYEQDAHAFTRRLHGVLTPGPLCYVAKIDAFVTSNNEMGIDCYKYQASRDRATLCALAASQGDIGEGKGEGIVGVRTVHAYWSIRIGEAAQDIFVSKFCCSLGPGCVDIVVIGERTLFALREQGTIRLQKFLEYQPCCACKYTVSAQGGGIMGATSNSESLEEVEMENIIIATETQLLMVYKDLELMWASRVSQPPVSLCVAIFGGFPGMVCSLDEEGRVQVCYQGTDPPTATVMVQDSKEIDYNEINEEHRRLLQVIRRSQIGSIRPSEGQLILRAQVPRSLNGVEAEDSPAFTPLSDDSSQARPVPLAAETQSVPGSTPVPRAITVRLVLAYRGEGTLQQATLNVSAPPGLQGEPSSMILPPITGGASTPLVVTVVFQARQGYLPSSLRGEASVVYTRESGGEPASAHCSFLLPLATVVHLIPPSNNSAHKFTLDTNRLPVPLMSLFEDTAEQLGMTNDAMDRISSAGGNNILSFCYWVEDPQTGQPIDASILVSKNRGRYRVQSNCLGAICLISAELIRRLTEYYGDGGECKRGGSRDDEHKRDKGSGETEGELRIEYTESLPLEEVYKGIDEHFEQRLELLRVQEELNAEAHQFRVIEKQLLVRFKDRNPSPLNCLDIVMEETYLRLIELGKNVEGAQFRLWQTSNFLGCAMRFLALLMKCRFQLGKADHALLLANFHPNVTDNEHQVMAQSI